jgi:AcrR family transcriptional regulator
MQDADQKLEGLRERKRRQTRQRIAEVGVKSFLAKGYEATTLDDIAAAAGISRRTFFHYFKSKDEILLAQIGSYADSIRISVIESATAGEPLDVARAALLKVVNGFHEPQMIAIARLMRESGALRNRRNASYLLFEQTLHEGLRELWPGKERRDRLRLAAMIAIGVLRLSTETWLQQDGKRPLATCFQETFENLRAEI